MHVDDVGLGLATTLGPTQHATHHLPHDDPARRRPCEHRRPRVGDVDALEQHPDADQHAGSGAVAEALDHLGRGLAHAGVHGVDVGPRGPEERGQVVGVLDRTREDQGLAPQVAASHPLVDDGRVPRPDVEACEHRRGEIGSSSLGHLVGSEADVVVGVDGVERRASEDAVGDHVPHLHVGDPGRERLLEHRDPSRPHRPGGRRQADQDDLGLDLADLAEEVAVGA